MGWFFKSKKEKNNENNESIANGIIVSTGDIPYDYDIIRPVWTWNFMYNGDLEAAMNQCNLDKMISQLQLQASHMGGDAVINMRVELNTTGGASTAGSTLLGGSHAYSNAGACMFCYGTAVRISYNNDDRELDDIL